MTSYVIGWKEYVACHIASWLDALICWNWKCHCLIGIHIKIRAYTSNVKSSVWINFLPGKWKCVLPYIYYRELLGWNCVSSIYCSKTDAWCIANKIVVKRIWLRCRWRRIRLWLQDDFWNNVFFIVIRLYFLVFLSVYLSNLHSSYAWKNNTSSKQRRTYFQEHIMLHIFISPSRKKNCN